MRHLLATLIAWSMTAHALELSEEILREKSRPTQWYKVETTLGTVALRYYLGALPEKVLTEIVSQDGTRAYFWGKWRGPGQVTADVPVPPSEGRFLTGQSQAVKDPPPGIFGDLE